MQLASLVVWAEVYAERLAAHGYSVTPGAGEQGAQCLDLESAHHLGCIVWWPWQGCEVQFNSKYGAAATILVPDVQLDDLIAVLERNMLL